MVPWCSAGVPPAAGHTIHFPHHSQVWAQHPRGLLSGVEISVPPCGDNVKGDHFCFNYFTFSLGAAEYPPDRVMQRAIPEIPECSTKCPETLSHDHQPYCHCHAMENKFTPSCSPQLLCRNPSSFRLCGCSLEGEHQPPRAMIGDKHPGDITDLFLR